MKSRILGIVLALCLLAAMFAALPVKAAEYYTGSVATTDGGNVTKTSFFRGDPVYVNVELKESGVAYAGAIRVELQRTTDGATLSWFTDTTNDPDIGWFNSSVSVPTRSLSTGAFISGELAVYDVVVYYTGGMGWDEIARTSIVVRNLGLTLSPDSFPYYPGEDVSITFVTTHTTDVFYVQIVNETGATEQNWTGQVALSGYWNTVWTIRDNFPDGNFRLYVRDAATHASWASTSFSVQKYMLMIDADRNGYLPGETTKMTYVVFDVETMTPYTGVSIEFSAHWQNNSGNDTWLNDTLANSAGVHEFVIPADIALYSDVDITYWANESTTRTFDTTVWLTIGLLTADVNVNFGPYMPGETVVVNVDAWAAGYNLPGAAVRVAIERNGSAISAYGSSGLMTDLQGEVAHSFELDSAAAEGSYIVNVTVSKVGHSVNMMASFLVEWDGKLILTFDKAYYYSGDDVELTFRTIWNNQEVTGVSVAYIVYASFGVMTTGNSSTGTAQFGIPDDYYGWLDVEAAVNIDGFILDDDEGVNVYFANIILTTQNDDYKQGDTIVFDYQILTSFTEGSLEWQIVDADGVRVASDTPEFDTSGSFDYDVPETNPSDSYTATMTMRTATGAMRTATATVNIIDDYQLSVWIGKSSYSTGEFKPGQTISINYAVNVYTFDHLPVYRLQIENSWDDTVTTVLVTDPTGTIKWQIPDDAPSGWFFLTVDMHDPVTGAHLWEDDTMFMVNNQLSGWDKSVGGMSAIDFTLLVLIVIMILLLIIVPFLKGKMGAPKAESAPAPPPAEPPKP